MDFKSFNNELALAQIQFMSIFSGIIISRELKSNKTKDIIVPCIFGQRSRIIKNLENPDLAPKQSYPLIIVERGGFERDVERVANLNLEQKMSPRLDMIELNYISPNPIKINYTVSILTKYPGDMDKILSNFLPFFNGDVYVKIPHPKIKDTTLKCQVVWNGIVTDEWSSEKEPYSDDIQITSMEFSFKTYLFGGKGAVIEFNKTNNPIKDIGSIAHFDFIKFYNENNVDGIINLNNIDLSNLPQEVIKILENACAPDGLLTKDIAEYLNKTYDNGYLTGMNWFAVPSIFSSIDKYLDAVKDGKISNPQYDVFQIVKKEPIEESSHIIVV